MKKNIVPIKNGQDLNTPKDAWDWFRRSGTSVSAWCRANGLNRNAVASLLIGRTRGHKGQSHAAAVALGLKLPPSDTTPN